MPEGSSAWRITFNGVQIGGLFSDPVDALAAVNRRREHEIAGPDLTDVPNPAPDLKLWHRRTLSQ